MPRASAAARDVARIAGEARDRPPVRRGRHRTCWCRSRRCGPGRPWAALGGEVEIEYRDHLYFQFAAGGFDITRNVVATRGLGLPR